MRSAEVIKQIQEVLNEHCDSPSDELIKLGKAMTGIGVALKGMSLSDAKATMEAVKHLSTITAQETKTKQTK